MLNLPQSTCFDKRIPKQKFYESLPVTPEIKRIFAEQIKIVYWRNKLATSTSNLAPGEQVSEIEVFEMRLNAPDLNEDVLHLIDREIPYHILFLLEHEGQYKAVIGYKEATSTGKSAFKVERYYRTAWMAEEELPLHMDGLTLDAVYENFVRQIAGDQLNGEKDVTLKESIEQQKQRERREKQIRALETKIRSEKQPKRKFELVQQLNILKNT